MKLLRFLVKLASGIVQFCGAGSLPAFCFPMAVMLYGIPSSLPRRLTQNNTRYINPTDEDTRSFVELQAINPDVFGWLNVYGTNIDYPLLQGEDNSST